MLSVRESAQQLGVSSARVRALIKDGRLPATKIGKEWALREEDVLQRLMRAPHAGRPRTSEVNGFQSSALERGTVDEATVEADVQRVRSLYDECRRAFDHLPDSSVMAAARSREEASFYMAVFDFFLQQRQRELVREGVY